VRQEPEDRTFERVAGITPAVRRIIKERKLSALSLKCVEGMMARMDCAPCITGTLVGNECFFVCERDVPGILGHAVTVDGKAISQQKSLAKDGWTWQLFDKGGVLRIRHTGGREKGPGFLEPEIAGPDMGLDKFFHIFCSYHSVF